MLRKHLLTLIYCVVWLAGAHTARADDAPCLRLGVLPFLEGAEQAGAFGEAIFKAAGVCVDLVIAPVRRSEVMTLKGQLDGELMRTKVWADQFKDQVVLVPTPLYSDDVIAVFLAERDFQLTSLDDLKGHRVMITGGNRWAEAQLKARGIDPLVESTPARYLEAIRIGRVDIGLTERSTAGPAEKDVNFAMIPVAQVSYHIVLRREHEALVPRLDAAIRALLARASQ